MKYILGTFSILVATISFAAQANLCEGHSTVDKRMFSRTSDYIEKHPVKTNNISPASIQVGQKIVTGDNEYTTIVYSKPYKVEFLIYPETEIVILTQGAGKCGPQIQLNTGKILSTGDHPTVETCSFETTTEEAEITPTGTSYLVESGALTDAIAELNGEASGGNNLVGVGQTGTIQEGSQEKYAVKKGTIQIKLKRLSKNKLRNKAKYVKLEKSPKKSKITTRFLAYNEKIKLKAGASLKIKRSKAMKKTQTADIEVIDPYSN